jgi:hypothetical protein
MSGHETKLELWQHELIIRLLRANKKQLLGYVAAGSMW